MPEVIASNLPLKAGEVVLGRLLTSRTVESVPAMPAVVRAVSMELTKWKVRFDMERELRGDALESFLAAPDDPRETASRARLIGIDPERVYTPVLFAFDVAALIEKHGSIVLRSVLSSLQRVFGAAPASASFVRMDGILLLVEQASLWRGATTAVSHALDSLRQCAPNAAVTAGIGRPAAGPSEYAAAIRQARLAANLAARLNAREPIDSAQIGAYRLLVGIEDRRCLQEFVDAYLGALVEHDAKRGTDFVRTLEAFHACGERLQPTSALLFVHVNTLKHRLRRVAALTERHLDDVSDRFNMYLALYALRLLEPDRHSLLPSGFARTAS
jgi:sugar diacid utilization regulator